MQTPLDTQRTLRTPLKRVRGLGAAHHGASAWWTMRMTSLALVPLGIWFIAGVISLVGEPREAVAAWLQNPVSAALMVLTLAVTFHHSASGVREILEDYVHIQGVKIAAIVFTYFACTVLAGISIFAVLRLAFGG
ncbi:MAG TPA: succinate dehydrogenase, hydrophobic membrane anchor protein [Azospirillaceae bacterium]|nr:succinate dehydrogenase, hydrophobic membrane anchor protein [Azospirillaceae bacterium]